MVKPRQAAVLLLSALLMTLSGCAAKPITSDKPAVTPVPPVASPAPSPAPDTSPKAPEVVQQPAPIDASDPKQLCRVPDGDLPHLLEAAVAGLQPGDLKRWIEETRPQAPCLTVSVDEGEAPLLLVSRWTKESDTGAVLWQEGARWVAAAAPLYQQIDLMRYIPEQREYIVATRRDGSGGYGRLIVLRDQGPAAGGVGVAYASDMYEHFGAQVLDDGHILLSGRDSGGAPLVTTNNCCAPGSAQALVVRSGDGFKEAARRHVPSPFYTFDAFVGALRKQDEAWLQRVAVPNAVTGARALHLDDPKLEWRYDVPQDLQETEWKHWPALPAAFNGLAPTATEVRVNVSLEGAPRATVTLNRVEGDWRVTAVSAPEQ